MGSDLTTSERMDEVWQLGFAADPPADLDDWRQRHFAVAARQIRFEMGAVWSALVFKARSAWLEQAARECIDPSTTVEPVDGWVLCGIGPRGWRLYRGGPVFLVAADDSPVAAYRIEPDGELTRLPHVPRKFLKFMPRRKK